MPKYQYRIVTHPAGYVIEYRERNNSLFWKRLNHGTIYSFVWTARIGVWIEMQEDKRHASYAAHIDKVVWGPKP